MALATGIAVANNYYNQPMLGLMERDLHGPGAAMIPTVTQLGYALGLFLLVPLADLVERRRLVVVQFMALACSLIAVALSPTTSLVVLASLLVGISATVAQQIVPFAAELAAPERRGAAIGTVMSGLFTGMLISRTLAGFVGALAGWRTMYWLGVPLALASGAILALRLPCSQPRAAIKYSDLARSLRGLWRDYPELRLAALTQAMLFASFSAFWTILVLYLQQPLFGLGAAAAGLFGILGLTGIVAAPVAGKFADRGHAHTFVLLGAVTVLIAWLVFALWQSVAGLVVGVVFLDIAVQSAIVSNQHIIYALRPEARSRINTLFMGTMYLGGSAGSSLAAIAWTRGGWSYVSLLGITTSVAAILLQCVGRRSRSLAAQTSALTAS